MWTKNGKKLFLKALLSRKANTEYIKSTGETISTTSLYNDIVDYSSMNTIMSINSTATGVTGTGFGVFCGSGDTSPTEDDYTLAEPLSLSYTAGSISKTYPSKIIQYTVQNNNAEAVTIRELGLCMVYQYANNPASNFIILLNRKLLSTPITLEVGEQALITFTVDTSNIVNGDGWTDNFKILSCDQFLNVYNHSGYINVKNTSNGNFSQLISDTTKTSVPIDTGNSSGPTDGKYYIYIGTGTTAPSSSDYTLEAPVTLKYLEADLTLDNNNNGLITATYQNNTTETYTISEICLCANFRRYNGFFNVMFNRKLLPTPVVMEPNDSYVFTYTINTSNLSE